MNFARTAAFVGASLIQCLVQAQVLPPPPVSPAPVVNYEYDANGNPTRVIQAPGAAGFAFPTSSAYDALNRRVRLTDAKAGETQFGYDGLDRTTLVIDPRRLPTQSPRNGLGDVMQLASPDTGVASHSYDDAGNLRTRTDSRGVTASYGYDALNRLISAVYSQPTARLVMRNFWNYDETGPGFANGIGRLTSTSFPSGANRYSYDAQGRLTTDTQFLNANAGAALVATTTTVSYGYDAAGHITSIVYPSGRVLGIGYSDGVPTAMSLSGGGLAAPQALITQIQYTGAGVVKGWLWNTSNGPAVHDRVFDNWGRNVRYRLGGAVRDIRYDEADRIVGYSHLDANNGAPVTALDQAFAYDELGRLTGIATAGELWTIGYDANGNRTSVARNGAVSPYTTSASSNRLDAIGNPPRSFGYDNAGNTLFDTGSGYTARHDMMGRLEALTKGDVSTGYDYNAQGQRVRKYGYSRTSNPLNNAVFVYDQAGQLLGEYTLAGAPLREYVWLGSTPVAMIAPDPAVNGNPPAIFYIHADHLDAPRVVVDTANNVRWTWLAEPFGTTVPNGNPAGLGVFTQNLRFPGQYADAESGLSYNYFRYYDSSLGRYTQSDPIGLAGGVNTYTYVGGNSVSKVDPEGLRDVIVAVWTSRVLGYVTPGGDGSAGHVFVGEMNGTTITSQFPTPHGMRGVNTTLTWLDTLAKEGRPPDLVYEVYVPDDAAFDAAAAAQRSLPTWQFWPDGKTSTHCAEAAVVSLRAGKFRMFTPSNPLTPDMVGANLGAQSRFHKSVTLLPVAPW